MFMKLKMHEKYIYTFLKMTYTDIMFCFDNIFRAIQFRHFLKIQKKYIYKNCMNAKYIFKNFELHF